MRQPPKAISGVVLLWVLAIAGCGSSGSSTAKSVPKIALKSPAIVGASIPARYTCDGKDISPPLEWGAVPADTSSLVLLVVGLIPEAATKTYKLSVEWAAAGLNPALHRLAAGMLPVDAQVGLTSAVKRRYSICPSKGSRVQYQFELYGLPASVSLAPGFGGIGIYQSLTSHAAPVSAHGAFATSYMRK
jgi:phosphatidylethanolamine-binding protein (PEBP) family uncharacterized protein